MPFQSTTATGTGTPLSIGPIDPNNTTPFAVMVPNASLDINTPAGWSNIGGTNFLYQQFNNNSPISLSTAITGYVDPGFSENWAAVMCSYQTNGSAVLTGAGTSGSMTTPGVTTSDPISVLAGQSILVQISNGSAGDVGATGQDPLCVVEDSSGNSYIPIKAVVTTGGFTYATYLVSAVNIPESNASLVITITSGQSANGPCDYDALVIDNLLSATGYCFGGISLW